jgi:hypothetical protein
MSHITPIFKYGDRKNCDNYRAISVTSTFIRMFGRIIRYLIETEHSDKEAKEQAKFRAGRSCNDNKIIINLPTQIPSVTKHQRQNPHIIRLLLLSAFVSVKRQFF